jgi:hypothetical protein
VKPTGVQNGSGRVLATEGRLVDPPPDRVGELAQACVAFVAKATGMTLDFEPETLSILDHYVAEARANPAQSVGEGGAQEKPEVLALVSRVAGVYFGEVVRRRHPSWWRTPSDEPGDWRLEFEEVYLSFSPVQLVSDALLRGDHALREGDDDGAAPYGALELLEEDRDAARQRLADLPEVPLAEYYAPSTRLEVIDIVVEAIRARRIADGQEAEAALGPDDYDD